ncbi:PKD-like domain-containing protein, partial [Belliella aquatica]|uniref:PKD-like domain-containing protein n=1 Tax=Belliella aquatica TaxID=1323734 RepID=UPI001E6557D2
YSWTNDNTAIGLAASSGGDVTEIPVFKALNPSKEPITATITVTPTFTNGSVSCPGLGKTFTITVNPTPVISNKAPEPICSGDAFTVNPVNVLGGDIVPSGTTYTWTVKTVDPAISGATASNTAGVVSISQMLTNSTNTVKAVIYLVTPTSGDDGSCVGDAFEIEVTVNPVAEVVATPDSEVICSEGSTNIQLSTPTSGTQAITYSWTAVITTPSTGGTISGFSDQSPSSLDKIIQPLTNSGTSPGVVTYTITPHIGDCAGRSIDVDVTVNPSGQADSVDDQIVCTGSSTQLVTFTT